MIPNHPAYMVEFYFWWEEGTSLDSLYLYKPTTNSNLADISILLDSASDSLIGSDTHADYYEETLNLIIIDSVGAHSYAYTTTVMVLLAQSGWTDNHTLRWHKLQIHKLENSSTIDLYVNGDVIGTYSSISGTNHPDSFLIGTEEVTQNGEGFWDDFIITTVPDGEHPRLLFTQSDIEGLRIRATDNDSTALGYSYEEMANKLIELADSCMSNDFFRHPHSYEYDMDYPFPQPQPSDSSVYRSWLAINREIEAWFQVLSFAYVIADNSDYAERADSILLSVSNKWSQWTNMQWGPQTPSGAHPYTSYDAAHLVASIALAYDMIFDQLADYGKMTIQNSLLSLGVNQDYLVSLSPEDWDDNPSWHPNGYAAIYSAMGLASLAIDDSTVSSTYDNIAKERIGHILDEPTVCDPQGGWIEGITYGEYGTDYIVAYLDAERRVRANNLFQKSYLRNYPEFRMYCTVFGENPGPKVKVNAEVNFEKYNMGAWFANEGVMYLVSENMNNYGQWYLANSFVKWPVWTNADSNHCIQLIQRYFLFGPFLWFDKELAPTFPDTLPLGMCAQGIGWGILRNGWDSENKVLALKSGKLTGGDRVGTNCHYAQNNFIYGSDGEWFIEDWGADNEKYMRYPDWHNVILINGTQSDFAEDGEIIKFYTSDEYGYIMGDNSNCDSHLNKWLREIVMVNNHGFIVVKDDIVCNDSVMIDWRIHSAAETLNIDCDGDSIKITKGENYLFGKVLEPEGTEWSVVPDDSVNEWKHISIVPDDSIQQVKYLVPFSISDTSASQPEIIKIEGTTMLGARIHTDSTDGVIMFGNEDFVEMVEYELAYTGVDSSLNVLVDLIPDTTYKVIVRDKDMNTLSMEELLSTDQGTMSFTIQMEEDTVVVFVGTDLVSDTTFATAVNSQRKIFADGDENPCFVYKAGWRVFHDYSDDKGETFDEITFGDGGFPALASFADTTTGNSCAAVWLNDKEIDFSRYSDSSGWEEPYTLDHYGGPTDYIHYAPPSFAIDDSSIGHLVWEIFFEPQMYPGYITYVLHHSTFDASIDSPTIIEDDTLDWTQELVDGWIPGLELGSASIDLDDDGNPVVAWSRAIGAGKHTVYLMQNDGTWPAEPETVSTQGEVSIHPFCDINNDKIHVVWEDEEVIKYRKRSLTGSWISEETVSDTLNKSRSPQIVSGNICVYTEEPQQQPNHHSHPVYSKRKGSNNWLPSNIIENTSCYSEYTQSYMYWGMPLPTKRTLHTIWTDGNEVPYKVKYKKVNFLIGIIRKHLTLATDTYIYGDVLVQSGVTLTINPGVRVMFAPDYDEDNLGIDSTRCELIIEGTLIAEGTEIDPIHFVSGQMEPAKGDWYGIRFKSNDVSSIKYANINFASKGIKCEANSSPIVEHVSISSNEIGIKAEQASPTIKKSSIFENYAGIYCENCTTVVIDSCDIYGNEYPEETEGGDGGTVTIPFRGPDTLSISSTGVSFKNCDGVTLTNNRIADDYVGLSAEGFVNGVFENNLVESNEWQGFDIAVTEGSQMQILDNTFTDNGTFPVTEGMDKQYYREFAGLSLGFDGTHTGETDILISGNRFEDNTSGTRFYKYYSTTSSGTYNVRYDNNVSENNFYGFALSAPTGVSGYNVTLSFNRAESNDSAGVALWFGVDSGAVNLGNLENVDPTDDGGNYITGNGTWDVMNTCPYKLYDQGNFCGTVDTFEIDNRIYDNEENPSNGMVDFTGHYTAGTLTNDETWQGVVSICGDITVPEDVTLTIEEGTTVRFAANYDILTSGVDDTLCELVVEGELVTEHVSGSRESKGKTTGPGLSVSPWNLSLDSRKQSLSGGLPEGSRQTSPESIIFTSDALEPQPGDWYGIRFIEPESRGLKAGGRRINEATEGPELSDEIELDEETLEEIAQEWQENGRGFGTTLENLTIEYAKRGITCLRKGYLKLASSYIGDCSEAGFSFDNEQGWVILDTITIERAHTGISSKSRVWLREGAIVECDSFGIHFDDCDGFIWKADINQNGVGILTSNSASPNIWYADITENTTGIYTVDESKPKVKNSKIIGNSFYGVYITDYAKPNFGTIGHNYIHGSGLYDLYNNTDNTIKAKRNYWGTMDIDTVEAHIYDYFDDSSLGVVQVEPLWEGEGGMGGVMSAGVGNIPFIYSLRTGTPNPFINNTTVFYSIAKHGNVSLRIYNVSGRLIKTLVHEKKDPGIYSERWHGVSNNNRKVAAGVYFTRLESADFSSVKKVILMR